MFYRIGVVHLFLGPIFGREAMTTPRRPKHYLYRSVYVGVLLILMCTAWLVLAGTQLIRNVGDMARFGTILFQILAPVQLALLTFLSALGAASAVSQEKDKRTLILLLMTRMSNFELVVGKLVASLLDVLAMLLAALPVFMLITLFGGVSVEQVLHVFLVTLMTIVAASSLGATVAYAREKTFQTLAVTALILVLWTSVWVAVSSSVFGPTILGLSCEAVAAGFSPFHALNAAAHPTLATLHVVPVVGNSVNLFVASSFIISFLLNCVTVLKVRVWNPSREVRPGQQQDTEGSIWGADHDINDEISADKAEQARQTHVDARQRVASQLSRSVWDNPVLWREVCTWAYGRKILVIRLAYLLFFAMAFAGLYALIASGEALAYASGGSIIPVAAKPIAPLMLISLVIINALAVNSITNERDGLALDLLLVTDLNPKEFVFGKLGGVFWITKVMIVAPMLLGIYLASQQGITIENLVYLLIGYCVLVLFVSMVGIHCGIIYANSRTAIGVSLGTVFFLFLGTGICIQIMISFSGSFSGQLAPFLAFILGGGVGLYVALGVRNPSPAIFLASMGLPFLTFFSITSFLLGNRELTVLMVSAVAYGFATAAMMIPALAEFDFATVRTKAAEEE